MFTRAGGRRNPFRNWNFALVKNGVGHKSPVSRMEASIEYQPKRTLFRHDFCDIMERKVAGPPCGKSETYSPPPGPRGPGHTIGHKVGAGCGCVHAPERDHPTSPPPTHHSLESGTYFASYAMGPTTTGNSSMYKIIWNTSRLTKFVNTQSLKNCSLLRSFTGL